MLKDEDRDVRAAAVAGAGGQPRRGASTLMRRYLADRDPRMAVTAAVALAASPTRTTSRRRGALQRRSRRHAPDGRRRAPRRPHRRSATSGTRLPAAARSADVRRRARGRAKRPFAAPVASADPTTCSSPPLLSLLRHRLLKAAAREVLVGYGEEVVDALAYFLRTPTKTSGCAGTSRRRWRSSPRSGRWTCCSTALDDPDGFLRYKVVTAHREAAARAPGVSPFRREPVEALVVKEATATTTT